MNLIDLLFGFQGRINRAKFWLALLIYVVFFFSVIGITMAVSSSMTAMMGAALVAYIPLIISGIAVGIKRLHDRNKSGWWLLLFYFGPLLLNAIGYYVLGGDDSGMLNQVIMYVSFGINIWALVELGCLRGTIGGNQYGGDPLAPQPAPPRTIVR
jgi:uncharacterized membrane protein YhaH (DUF805 family)